MESKVERIVVYLTVPKAVIDVAEGPYFYEKGLAGEEDLKNKTERATSADFDGFLMMDAHEQNAYLGGPSDEETVTAKLFYLVTIASK